MRTKGPPMSLDALLDAAEEVVATAGISGLTFDAVAARAGVSKGGLLHHFPSKDALIAALIQRIVGHWRALFLAAIDRAPHGPGRTARALRSMVADSPACPDAPTHSTANTTPGPTPGPDAVAWTESCRRMSMTLMAAMVSSPQHLQPLRDSYRDIFRRLDADDLPPGHAEAVMAALDGMWLWMMLDIPGIDPGSPAGRMARVIDALDTLLHPVPAISTTSNTNSPAPTNTTAKPSAPLARRATPPRATTTRATTPRASARTKPSTNARRTHGR